MTLGVVLVAAGQGHRLEASTPKGLVPVAGTALVSHAVDRLGAADLPPPVVVHTPGWHDAFAAALAGRPVAALVPGGTHRSDSVRRGLEALGAVDLVAVHDAARALMPAQVIRRVVAAVAGEVVAAAPARAVPDTLKRVEGDRVVDTVDREGVVAVQTPQVFVREVLARALAGGGEATDDLVPVERLVAAGEVEGRVVVVAGSPFGLKVTFPEDLDLAALVAGSGP